MSTALLTAAEIARVLSGSTLAIQLATLLLSVPTTLTISGGVVTATQTMHKIATEGAAASDNLDTITGGASFPVLILQVATAAQAVVLKHGTGNITCPSGADITLSAVGDMAILTWNGTTYTVATSATSATTGILAALQAGIALKVAINHVASGSLVFAAGDTSKTAVVGSGFNGSKAIVCFGADPLLSVAGGVWGVVSGDTLTVTLGIAPGGAGTTVNYLLYY
jgi:hypothetical protein